MFNIFKRKQPAPTQFVELRADPKPFYIMTEDGNITLRWDGKTHAIGNTHPNYTAIVAALLNETPENLNGLLNVSLDIQEAKVEGITVTEYGEVYYRGEELHGVIVNRIREFISQGLPHKPLLRFLGNLMENPSERARNELYGFLQHGGFPITHDGCFLAYKGLNADWTDCHTGTFDNSIGSVNEMPREKVDPDMHAACSTGFHVGTHKYASDFARGQLVLVKVNPRDAVSVPLDHDCEKLRVCRYEVVEVCEGRMVEPLHNADTYEDEYEDEGEYAYDESYEDDEDEVEVTTGRRRGPGGRFLPS